MLDIDKLPAMYSAWRTRYEERDLRCDIIDRTVKGDFDEFDPDEENVTVHMIAEVIAAELPEFLYVS